MLNSVIIMGRITRDLELRTTGSGATVLSFTVAVDRGGRQAQGEDRQADFISCVAWNQQAEFINRYFGKGRMIALEGSLRTGSFDDKNGVKHYTTEVWVNRASFTGEPKAQGGYDGGYQNNYQQSQYQQGGYQQRNDPPKPAYNEPENKPISIGDMNDFEDILSSDGVPF